MVSLQTFAIYLTKSAKRFFKKALASCHTSKPRVLTVDKNPAYPK
ncbi:hypothetical protein IIC_04581, partial [Bacillus cereus VD021]